MSKKYFCRAEPTNSKDYYPTPPWATRALFEKVLSHPSITNLSFYNSEMTALEPACGQGYMSVVLRDYFHGLDSYDIQDFGYGMVADFLKMPYDDLEWGYDWVITNPPFNHEMPAKFALKALTFANKGVAIFARFHLIEGKWRYDNLFSKHPPTFVAPFVERVTIIKNEVTRENKSVTPYAWFIWDNRADVIKQPETKIIWIPPCKKELERNEDYNGTPNGIRQRREHQEAQ